MPAPGPDELAALVRTIAERIGRSLERSGLSDRCSLETGALNFLYSAGIAAEDIGKTGGIYGEALTIKQMGDTISQVLGVGTVVYNAVDADTYRGFGFPGADELGNMFQVYRDFEKEVLGARSVDLAHKLNPELQSYADFVKKRRDAILAALG